jgi:hypothetical protein
MQQILVNQSSSSRECFELMKIISPIRVLKDLGNIIAQNYDINMFN